MARRKLSNRLMDSIQARHPNAKTYDEIRKAHASDLGRNKSRSNGETPSRIQQHTEKQTSATGDGRVKVGGYTKADGTRVKSHVRRSDGLKTYMAVKASKRGKAIREYREKVLSNRY